MAAMTAEKPEYLGLLNAISLAESNAGVYLKAWANATDDEDLACCLNLVAAREASHGEVFCRRIAELGFELKHNPTPDDGATLVKFANPKISDLEKIGPPRAKGEKDTFADLEAALSAGKYDPMTTNLLTWYIAEERDSGRRLAEAYGKVRAKAKGAGKMNGHADGEMSMASGPSSDAQAIMACMTDGFARLEKTLEKLAKSK